MSNALNALLSRRIHFWENRPFREWGDLCLHISIFDHWLTEAEAEDNKTMSYRLAIETGNVELYEAGERLWTSFYLDLASEGARVVDLKRDRMICLPASSGRLSRIIRDSLRERRRMDVIFNRWPVRVRGGYDRTDTFLPATQEECRDITQLARNRGLHVLL